MEINYEKETDTRIEFTVKVSTKYKNRVTANFVEFWIPLPQDA